MDVEPTSLVTWLAGIRERVACGGLAGLWYVTADGDVMPADRAARIFLADLDHDRVLSPGRRMSPFNVERRRMLLADLRRLREQVG